jgi:hypothetical protein
MRLLFTIVVPLLLPAVVYLLWLRFAVAGGDGREKPWLWLVAAGVALAAIVVGALTLSREVTDGVYVPPHMEDGRLVPGRISPAGPH